MRKKLSKNLIVTFLLSLLLTGFLYATWYGLQHRGFEQGQAMVILFAAGDIFQNTILAIATLPVYLLTNPSVFNNSMTRALIYFGGPVLLTLLFIFLVGNSKEDKISFLLPGLSFISIHAYFYFKLTASDSTTAV